MMKPVTEAHIHRSREGSAARRPLRLEIARRRAHTRAGAEKFVTEVRFGDAAALFVPWSAERRGGSHSALEAKPGQPVEPRVA